MNQARHGEYKMPGGKLLVIDLDVEHGRLLNVQLSGDFFLEPDSALESINQALEGRQESASKNKLIEVLRSALGDDVMMYGISIEAIAVTVHRALNSPLNRESEA